MLRFTISRSIFCPTVAGPSDLQEPKTGAYARARQDQHQCNSGLAKIQGRSRSRAHCYLTTCCRLRTSLRYPGYPACVLEFSNQKVSSIGHDDKRHCTSRRKNSIHKPLRRKVIWRFAGRRLVRGCDTLSRIH